MTMIVGFAPDERGKSAVHLAAMLARASGDDVVVCAVVPAPWQPGMARVDAEYQAYLDSVADRALDEARALVPDDIAATFLRHRARSAPAGLLEVAGEHAANLVVLGSSSAGVFGHVVLGSVSDRLLHSSPISVALAPRGFRCKDGVDGRPCHGGVRRVRARRQAGGRGRRHRVSPSGFTADRVVRGLVACGVHVSVGHRARGPGAAGVDRDDGRATTRDASSRSARCRPRRVTSRP